MRHLIPFACAPIPRLPFPHDENREDGGIIESVYYYVPKLGDEKSFLCITFCSLLLSLVLNSSRKCFYT